MSRKNFHQFQKTFSLVIFVILVNLALAIKPIKLTKKIYEQKISSSYDNIHYFVITSKSVLTSNFLNVMEAYSDQYKLELYQCNPTDSREFCPLDTPIFLIINTIKIEFNGHREHPEDLLKWVKFRIQQFPKRLHSTQQLREYVSDKNEVFCFIDRQGEQMTKKEYIFIATAKKLHFLHYCSLDINIAKELSLKEGHLALIRHDLSYNFDYWSEKTHEDSTQLHQLWINFLISSCQSDFRVLNRNKSHDLITIDCDLSLQCQQNLYSILLAELQWRKKHPQINFKINLLPKSSKYESTGHEKKTKFPVFKFAKTIVEKRIVHQQSSGAVLEQTDYIRDTYKLVDPIINEDTIDIILDKFKNKKLSYVIRNVETDIRSLDGQQGEYHREIKRREDKQKNRQQL